MRLSLVVLAAGQARRFGRLKQLEPVGPSGEALFEYLVHDAIRAGCDRVVFLTRPDLEARLRRHVADRLGHALRVDYVTQESGDVPRGFRSPVGRRKPWGTGHAVLAVRHVVREPFIVANADDFYGPSPVGRLAKRIRDARSTGDPSHFLVGYELRNTSLSDAGGVNRAICRCDSSMVLEAIEEVRGIVRSEDGITGTTANGGERPLAGEELASMNLWGFQPAIFEPLWHLFERFHAALQNPLDDEFLLSDAIGSLVAARRIRVRVLPTDERGFAMTYLEDLDLVDSAVAESVAAGFYPTDLARWFGKRRGTVPG